MRSNIWNSTPPPGKLVDVGGYKLHVWREGPRTKSTVVLLAGSNSQGLWLRPTQKALGEDVRSCVIDRGGTGWSDIGPFHRSMDRVLSETRTALSKAGETTPFIFVGHSLGGLYAANLAQRYPDDVAGIVLIDPTEPTWQALFAADGCRPQDGSLLTMFGTMFGLGYIQALNPLYGPGLELQCKQLGSL